MNSPALVQQGASINLFDPAQFDAIQRLCGMYVNSDLVPESYRVSANRTKDKAIANCVIAVSMAQRMNMDHLMVMQNLDIIQGRPSWSAKFLIAVVNTCGRFEPLEYKMENLGKIKDIQYTDYEWQNGKKVPVQKMFKGELDNLRCVAYTTDKGKDKVKESPAITIEMAIKEGWYTKSGSKWQTMPELMMKYRAASTWQRTFAPELSMGLITQEEAREIEDVDYVEVRDVSSKLKEELRNANAEEIKAEKKTEENRAATAPDIPSWAN